MGTMPLNKYEELIKKLAEDELEGQNLGVEYYAHLMALYIYADNLIAAKYLWTRMPQSLKGGDEVKCLHHLLKCALDTNTAEFFKATTNFNWSDVLKPIMNDIIEKMRKDVMDLVGEAYTSILETDLMTKTQLSREELQTLCQQLQWSYEKDGEQLYIIPKPPQAEENPLENSEDQLENLTDFVTFLES